MKSAIEIIFSAILPGAANSAPASWTAAALCRFASQGSRGKSDRGLPQSRTSRNFGGFNFLLIALLSLLLAGCSKTDSDDKPAVATGKNGAPEKAGATLDPETQERLGLKIETPTPAQWEPQLGAVGNVADPLIFAAAAADFEAARAAAAASQSDFERIKTLAAQNNASPRALETAQATATRDALAVKTAQAKFAGDWGVHLAARPDLAAYAEALQTNELSLVKLSLPVGTFPAPLPQHATVSLFGSETNSLSGDFSDDLGVAPATQTQMLLFSVNKKLPPGIAVTARLKTSGEPVTGVMVPFSAVLRHQGAGWVYVQMDTNRFLRTEIPLDRLTDGGWFISENLSATNRIVVTGAQAVLSAELSAGAFTTGERD
jgi:hypothetical protein